MRGSACFLCCRPYPQLTFNPNHVYQTVRFADGIRRPLLANVGPLLRHQRTTPNPHRALAMRSSASKKQARPFVAALKDLPTPTNETPPTPPRSLKKINPVQLLHF